MAKMKIYLCGDGVRAAPEFVLPAGKPLVLLTYWDQKERLTERFRQLRSKYKGKRVFFEAKPRTQSIRQKRKNPKVNSGKGKKK